MIDDRLLIICIGSMRLVRRHSLVDLSLLPSILLITILLLLIATTTRLLP